MDYGTAQPSDAPGGPPTNPARPAKAGLAFARSAAALLLRAALTAAVLGPVACGWKTPQPGPSTIFATTVEMRTQDGDYLGTRELGSLVSTVTLTMADVGNRAGLSSKYIVIRRAPSGGVVGPRVAVTNTGSVSFQNSVDGKAYQAIFMSTSDLPESVMDCFVKAGAGYGGPLFTSVSRIPPGSSDFEPDVTILDGDESILIGAIDEINKALIDRQGVALGRLTWKGGGTPANVEAGFADLRSQLIEAWADWGYVLVNPRDSRDTQALTALEGFFKNLSSVGGRPCGQAMGTYLVDPPMTSRLSRQGVSIIRFVANYSR